MNRKKWELERNKFIQDSLSEIRSREIQKIAETSEFSEFLLELRPEFHPMDCRCLRCITLRNAGD